MKKYYYLILNWLFWKSNCRDLGMNILLRGFNKEFWDCNGGYVS